MKSKRLLLMLLIALIAPWAANAQTTVEIGDGTDAINTNPIGTYYNYSITEQLYTAEEIGTAGTISSISFYYAGTIAKDFPIAVYMKNVDDDNLTTTGISLADADLVFEGTYSITGTGWFTINLDTPFAYDGTSSLLIGINKDYVYWYNGGTWQSTATEAVMARYSQQDGSAYTTGTTPGSVATARPNIQIVITPSGATVCEKPESMEASDVTTNSATLTWTGGSGTYNVEYKGGSVADWTAYLTNTTATTANLTGLTPGTNYQYRVQSVCSDGTSGWKSVSFQTMFGIPLVEGFGTTIPSGWSIYSGLVEDVLAGGDLTTASYGWSFGSNNGVFDDHARVNLYGTGCNYWLVLPTLAMEDNVQLMFEVALTAYSGTGAPAQTGDDDKFVVLVNNGRTWEIVRQWDNAGSEYVLNDLNTTPITVAIDLSNYAEAGQPITVAFYGESTVSNADNNLHIDNVSIDYIPACAKPTGLAVNYEGGTEATISWTSDATVWNMRVNGTEINGTITNPYTLTGLELATTYEVEVQANCGDATSDWVGPVSFKTDNCMPEDMCALTFVVTDSYGDGWNGASIDIYDYTGETLGDLLASVANTSDAGAGEAQTYTLNFCNGQELAIFWTSGSYDSEASYTVTDINGDVVVEGSGNGFDGFAYTMNCTVTDCRRPTDFVASEIGNHSVKLSWTENGPATSWNIEYISANDSVTTTITVNTNPYILTGLTPETAYAAQVTPVCEVDKPSEVITWTTDIACPKPSDLSVTPYPFTADVTWNGFAEAYDIEWAQPVESTSSAWLQYDDGTMVSNVGNSTASTWTWGVMYPADMLEGNTLTKIAFYEVANSYYTDGTVTLNVYSGGDAAPGTLIGTKTIATEGTNGMREVVIDPIEIDASQNLWITLTANATYCMTMSAQDGGANSRWFLNGSNWVDFGTLYSTGAAYSYMIRGFVETTNYSAWNWSSESGITSPYTITGLEAETDYAVRVKAVCGGEDGESLWTWAYFTTPSACDAPVELEATDITYNAATLNWVGYQDNYNLRYREAVKYDAVWEEDFENGLDQWTLVQGASATGSNWYTIDLTTALQDVDALSGTHCASSWSWSTSAYQTDNWLITPQLDLQGVLKYYVRTNAGYPDHYEVLLSTTDNDTTSFTVTLKEYAAAPNNGEWNEVIIDLSDYAGQQGYIAIHHVDYDMNYLCIDDFGIYNVVEASDWNNVVTTETTYNVTGLEPETEYEWQVQGVNADCGDLGWSEIVSFNTISGYYWTAEDYPNNMFMVGVVQIDGVEQASPALELGAFCNGECRGTEFPEYDEDRWVYYMNIVGNNGDEITFRLYDHSQQQELNLYCFSVLPFESYGLIGMDAPYEVLFTSTVAVSSSVSPDAAGTVTGTGEYGLGTEATVTATANAGYQFNSWAIDGEIVSTEASYTFTVTAPVSLTANFDGLYSVSAEVNLEGAGTVTGTGEYLYGTDVTLTATANPGYAFNNWTLEGEVVSTEPTYTFTVTGSVVVTANFNVVHTQQLVQGYNWFSTFVEISLDDLKSALVAALPGTTISINSQSDGSTTYNGARWRGSLNSLDLSQMYMINVTADCEMTLEGLPIDPSEHVATIHPNFNWMAFPLRQGMTLTNAFAGFVVNGDMVISQSNGSSTYFNQWRGGLNTFEPGKGYMYKSNVQGDRTFTFPMSTK